MYYGGDRVNKLEDMYEVTNDLYNEKNLPLKNELNVSTTVK